MTDTSFQGMVILHRRFPCPYRCVTHVSEDCHPSPRFIHLGREGVKELRERLEHVPPRTRGDFRGVIGNPHQVLIQQWIPPSSPPLAKGGESENNELLQGLTNS